MVKYVAPSLLALILGATSLVSADNLVGTSQERGPMGTRPASSEPSCSANPLDDDVLAGVDLVADASCSSGDVGCLGTMCHFCQRWNSDFSGPLPLCKGLEGPKAIQTCDGVPTLKDPSLGVTLKNDPSCADGSVGCVRSGCRICRERNTPKSMKFKICSSIPVDKVVTTALAQESGQEHVANQGSSWWTVSLIAGGCAVMAIGGMVFAAKRMTRDSTSPEIITPSNSIAYQRASVFHI